MKPLSLLALAGALWLAVLDATAAIAAREWAATPLEQSWNAFWPQGLAGFRTWADAELPAALWEEILAPLLALPGWAVLALLAVLLGLCSYENSGSFRGDGRRNPAAGRPGD